MIKLKIFLAVFIVMFGVLAPPFTDAANGGIHEWSRQGPVGGVVSALVIDPSDSSTLYAATDNGLHKSVDGGAGWSRLAQSPQFAVDIAIDRRNPSILYAGASFRGVYKSSDGGDSWSRVLDRSTRVVVLDPQRSATLYAGGDDGLFKSEDGGGSWRPIQQGLGLFAPVIWDIVVSPGNSKTLYVAIESVSLGDGGVFKSVNGGESWTATNDVLLEISDINSLAVDPRSPSVLYAGTGEGVFQSEDGGDSWRILTHLPAVQVLTIDPLRPSTLYAGAAGGLFKSVDGGASWFFHGSGLELALAIISIVVDSRDPSLLYVGTGGSGIYRSFDGAMTWQPCTQGPVKDAIRTLAVDSRFPLTLYAGGDFGLHKSVDGGLAWRRLGTPARSITDLAVAPSGASTLYFSTEQGGVFKSLDGGETWLDVSGQLAGLATDRLLIDPEDPATVYVATSDFGVYKSANGGQLWSAVNEGLPTSEIGFSGLLLNPLDGEVVYAGIFPGRRSPDGGVYKTEDGGSSWFLTGFADAVAALAMDPVDPSILFVGTPKGDGFEVWQSLDGGQTWFPLTAPGLPGSGVIHALAVDAKSTIYAGTSEGVFRKPVGDEIWTAMIAGLRGPAPYVHDLAVTTGSPITIYASGLTDPFENDVFDWTEVDCSSGAEGCLVQGRFFVEVKWRDFAGRGGRARRAPVHSSNSAVLWFFEPGNWEMLVKVLDGCAINGQYWFYASAATNVAYTIQVADLESGVTKTYSNSLGHDAPAIVDNEAFATCP